jgi:zinc D-Ala-D-Ala dipeptidase
MRHIHCCTLATAALLAGAGLSIAQSSRPADFVDAASVVKPLVVDLRYSTPHNFVGARVDGYEQPVCLLTKQAADALAAVAQDIAPLGLGLKAFDCYRPARAVAHFVRWAKDLNDQKEKSEFYPDVDKQDLFRLGYIAEKSSHSRGSTVDLTLVERSTGREIDMGTPFDFFSSKSWPEDRSVTGAQRENRNRLRDAMRRRGFAPYDREWWHFTLKDEPFPGRSFDIPVR